MKVALTFVLLAGALDACSPDEWTGFVYPNRSDLTKHIEIGAFDSFEGCKTSAINTMRQNNWQASGDYECGRNCRPSEYGGWQVCKETKR